MVIVVPCTSNIQALRFPFTLRLEPSPENGLEVSSVALVLHLRAIDKKRMRRRIGKIEQSTLKEFDVMIKNLLSL